MRPVAGVFDPEVLAIARELRLYRLAMNIPIKVVVQRSKEVDRFGCGFAEFAIRRWEGEDRVPDLGNLKVWAAALGYNIKVTLEVPQ